MGLVLGLATAVFVADQLTKTWALQRLDATHPVVVIPDFFHFVLVMNPGVAFGIFAGVPPGCAGSSRSSR
jgi:lipoprotein signal peptidase